MASKKYIIGIDEVGRGPLAGPITVAAVAAPVNSKFSTLDSPSRRGGQANSKLKLKDSKKLLPHYREAWFDFVKNNPKILYAVAKVSPSKIDRINVAKAANLAATRAFFKLVTRYQELGTRAKVFLDGSLYLNEKPLVASGYTPNPKTIVKGDEKIPEIQLASVIAKVTRDRTMLRLHKKYPHYGFDAHKGYGTKKHFAAIKKYGPSKMHRLTFLKKFTSINTNPKHQITNKHQVPNTKF